jgi:hypothetical protein
MSWPDEFRSPAEEVRRGAICPKPGSQFSKIRLVNLPCFKSSAPELSHRAEPISFSYWHILLSFEIFLDSR